MKWIIIFILMMVCAFVGFMLGVAYGQEHPHE